METKPRVSISAIRLMTLAAFALLVFYCDAELPPAAKPLAPSNTLELENIQPAIVAAKLGKEPQRIFEFVRDKIAYEPYAGCLRGPRGTLLARAGNSVDRATLLASMLEAAGERVRFARGALPEKEAITLVNSTWTQPTAETQPSGVAPDSLKKALEKLKMSRERDFRSATEQLRNAHFNKPEPIDSDAAALVKIAQTHYWVQHEKGAGWVDLDPSFLDAVPGHAYTTASETFQKLPEALFHQTKLHLVVEEYPIVLNGTAEIKPTTREILHYTAKSADLAAVDLVLLHPPEKGKKPAKGIQDGITSATTATGRVKPKLLTATETLVDGQFETKVPKSSGLGGMSGMLSGAGTRKAAPVAVAERLEFEFIAPDGAKKTTVREIFDIVGKARRSAGTRLSAEEVSTLTAPIAEDLSGNVYDIFFTNGRLDGANFANLTPGEPRPSGKTHIDLRRLLRRINLAFTVMSDQLGRIAWPERSIIRLYPDSPRVSVAEVTGLHNKPAISLDLRRGEVRAIATGSHPEDAFSAQLFRGINDGTLERVFVENLTERLREKGKTGPVISTSSVFERAAEEKVPITLWKRDTAETPFTIASDEAKARVEEEHKTGAWLIGPARELKLGSRDRFAWWRINPQSGVTVAVTDEGMHQTGTERVVVIETSDETVLVTVGTESANGTVIGNGAFTQEFEDLEDAESYINWLNSQGYRGGLSPPGVIPQSADIPTAAFP
jgi:hypothetical protein